ncbi:hypothetical protein VTN31DRAFT_2692 [Thermomyces dupontii]|uniref:uncharacterized protein n=1 Tax=Talaromyces thermophilus TaxID=28565 RepID=UPI0037428769
MSSPQDNDTKETSPEELRARLADLTEKAAAKDAIRDYEAAAELYSQATEIQAKLNGEMAVENAELLYAYGKALYNVAVSKSDVLGSKITSEATTSAQDKSKSTATKEGLIKAAISAATGQGDLESAAKAQGNNKLFQFSGDENFEASDSEDEEEEGQQPEEEEDDEEEFENAYEVLDLARVLSMRKIEELEATSTDKGKGIAPEVRPIKERLANIYDLQAEISLEAEHFHDAVEDLRSALELKEALYPLEDPSVAECHYKLSLALEFASVERPGGDGEEQESADATKPTFVNTTMREEAVKHMETAIESCKLRMAQEEEKIKNGEISEEGEVHAARRKIENVKEIVSDMEQRLADLRRPPISSNEKSQDGNALNGILDEVLGRKPVEQKTRLEEVSQKANDLSSLVRKKKSASGSSSGDRKRPHEDEEADATDDSAKRTKTEE